MDYYRLEDDKVEECSIEDFMSYLIKNGPLVRQSNVVGNYVSTVFLGVSSGTRKNQPLVFETLVFDKDSKIIRRESHTDKISAISRHDYIVAMLTFT